MFRLHVEALEAQGSRTPEKAGRTEGVPSSASSFDVTVHHELVPDVGGPRWHHDKIERVAKARQAMMERSSPVVWAHDDASPNYGDYDALFLVDTDCILGPGVLERMWAVDADVVYGTFWTRDDWGQPCTSDVAPQVWFTHPYDWHPQDVGATNCWNALCEPGINEVEVNGGGACTLIRGRGFESHYWPLLESLKGAGRLWPGEDRTFCLGLECRGIKQIAITGLPIVHLYTPELRTPEMLAKAREMVGLGKVPA